MFVRAKLFALAIATLAQPKEENLPTLVDKQRSTRFGALASVHVSCESSNCETQCLLCSRVETGDALNICLDFFPRDCYLLASITDSMDVSASCVDAQIGWGFRLPILASVVHAGFGNLEFSADSFHSGCASRAFRGAFVESAEIDICRLNDENVVDLPAAGFPNVTVSLGPMFVSPTLARQIKILNPCATRPSATRLQHLQYDGTFYGRLLSTTTTTSRSVLSQSPTGHTATDDTASTDETTTSAASVSEGLHGDPGDQWNGSSGARKRISLLGF